jgi:hypothetical protein
MMNNLMRGLLAATLTVASATVAAKATPEQIRSLGGAQYTPVGAEKAGNSSGTIPAWEGGLTRPPPGFDAKQGYADPFAGDKILYTVTARNMEQYRALLAPGQMAMLKTFPEYKLNVYPSRRTAAIPAEVAENVKREAGLAELVDEGNGVTGVSRTTVPFPFPKTGVEVIWNHTFRYRGKSATRYLAAFPVQSNGTFVPITYTETLAFNGAFEQPEPNRLLYIKSRTTSPSNLAGNAYTAYEPINQVSESRVAFLYNPGQRRVLRAPEFAYDYPGTNSDGLRTVDDYDGFNGAPDRYQWKLVGKKEMLIAYNNYKLSSKALKYRDIVKPGHINQDLVRYEPHRVWVVEATLRPGQRHIYAKRTFYVDEDSWQVAHVDQFDGRGELWRVHELHMMQFYDQLAPWISSEVIYDLQARRYLMIGLSNEERAQVWNPKLTPADFSSDNLRRTSN